MTAARRLRLAVRLTGAPGRTGTAFSQVEQLARTAERGLFDFLLLVGDAGTTGAATDFADCAAPAPGCPEPLTALGALAAVTDRIGLAAAVDPGATGPYDIARAVASLDHLSGGRAGWALAPRDVPGQRPPRRGADRAERYRRAAESVRAVRALWDSWPPGGPPRPVAHHGRYFTVEGEFTVPRCPQGRPPIVAVLTAGDSARGRDLAARTADVLLSRHRGPAAGRALTTAVGARLAAHGRRPADLAVMPEVTVVLGDSAADAEERAAGLRRPRTLPYPPVPARRGSPRERDGAVPGPLAVPSGPRRVPARRRTPLRAGGPAPEPEHPSFTGTAAAVAARMESYLRERAADGFVLVPHPAHGGLDEFVDRVVPLLQERGLFRTAYEGATLRSHLGLPEPVWKG
ncbi:LLM class flavin-dependent oxidoreductase [Streptomyces yaizuensis]|uniref:LLM class flavin-dependent oxidoreductase n=1 Tax=Streptomyces yaizuensis TaxID=2989713 RepID=A0ABQ5P0N4_9ACTN|nr:LLM class flavin-dependent oxidoreductase [Streptomyces sp. YSPA8]GLF96163.1 LLM class flavin-dependent oxidoreductase [Streptomyces sp. YSPA8]